ncbi:Leucine-rich repeat protein kinase family protein [Rhynchospora pubera]|uniref:non-specific serine/threonine protein kinase n=1 Tax=Rhynchospora pubera TaxID=906938 RepID=A0AAV8C668_9POAL|nr:Leucine-rich repeat protein kinase family protein [Rhynchospora pubera]
MPKAEIFLSIVTLVLVFPSNLLVYGAPTTDPTEVNALKVIRNSLYDPMNKLRNWNNGDPCTTNWTGIYCQMESNDNYLHIAEIQLFHMNLSGTLSPQLSSLSHLKILDFMWNNISGTIPKEIGSITSLKLVLLNGNQLSGYLPTELGNLPNLNRLQIDENQISGPIPTSFMNLSSVKHLHMNNNSLSGQIPAELSKLPRLLHLLVDNNNLSGHLPEEFSEMPSIHILQFDNNNFGGTSIPPSYANISTLLKLSVRNCSLQGNVPDLTQIPQLGFIDLSWNQLTGPLPTSKFSTNITTIDVSHNKLNSTIPDFSGLPNLQLLALEDNFFEGSVPPNIWDNTTYSANKSLVLDFQNNSLTNVPADFDPPTNVTVLLSGNPLCSNTSISTPVGSCQFQSTTKASGSEQISVNCQPCPTDRNYEYNPSSTLTCFCAVPLGIGMRLKSPGISDFRPYVTAFEKDLTGLLNLYVYQLYIEHYIWETGPRLNMQLKLFPSNTSLFSVNEIIRVRRMLAGWEITLLDIFGPYELLNFTLGSYANDLPSSSASGLSKGAIAGIAIGAVAVATAVSVLATMYILKRRWRYTIMSKRSSMSKFSIKIDGVRCFTFEEMAKATKNFNESSIVGQGGYGKVYKGVLDDGTVVAIKRAHEESLQGSKEFCTEIELLSRLHHRNLVSLVGYCDEMDEQMLVYEFMPNGTLRDHLSVKCKEPLNFNTRLHIALGSSKGILYLHTEANPPIFHRDIKASNILLDSKFVPKVADFGLSRLAPIPEIEGTLPGHVSTVVKGTPGYLDPEYFLTHKLTDKSDVYSLGVVFLELVTGMRPIAHGKNIVREVTLKCQSGNTLEIVDSRMESYPIECVKRFLSLALRCCQDETDLRPSMSEVVRELEVIWRMMPDTYSLTTADSSDVNSTKMIHSTSSVSSVMGNTFLSSNELSSENTESGLHNVTPR